MTSTCFPFTSNLSTPSVMNITSNISAIYDVTEDPFHDEESGYVEEYASFITEITPYVVAIDIIAGLGVIGNILTIVLMTSQTLRKHSYAIYMIVLAISDSLVLFMIAVEDNTDHIFHMLDTMFNSSIIICKAWTFIGESFKVISPWTLVAMTLDRFIVVVFPLHKVRVCTVRYSVTVCCVVSVVVLILNSPFLYYLQYHPTDETKEGYICDIEDINMHYYYMTMSTLVQSVLPVIILIIINVQTAVILRRAAKSTLRRTKSGKSLDEAKLMKITISLILVSAMSAIALVPFAINSLVEYILIMTGGDRKTIQLFSDLWMVFNVIRLLNYGMNFYVLVSFSDQYRQILADKFMCSRCASLSKKENSTSSIGMGMDDKTDTNISTISFDSSAL